MIRRCLLCACWLTLSLAPSAWAADWVRLGRIPGDDQYFYDRSKLVIQDDGITYWKKVLFKKSQPIKNQFAAWALMRERIDCTQHTLRLISYLYYAADGSTIEYVADHEKDGTPIIPDTLGDAFERHMCALVTAKREAEKKEEAAHPASPPSPAPVPAESAVVPP